MQTRITNKEEAKINKVNSGTNFLRLHHLALLNSNRHHGDNNNNNNNNQRLCVTETIEKE